MHISIENLKTFFYFEPSFFLFVGKISSFKFKSISKLFYEFAGGFVKVSRSILSVLYVYIACMHVGVTSMAQLCGIFCLYSDCQPLPIEQSLFRIWYLFLKGLLSTSTGWNAKLRSVGIGYKVYFYQNLLVLKLGYSHYVIYLLPYELSIVFIGRKKRSFMLSCSDHSILSLVTGYIACLRIPNVYTGKGIRLRGNIFLRKEGKKSQC